MRVIQYILLVLTLTGCSLFEWDLPKREITNYNIAYPVGIADSTFRSVVFQSADEGYYILCPHPDGQNIMKITENG